MYMYISKFHCVTLRNKTQRRRNKCIKLECIKLAYKAAFFNVSSYLFINNLMMFQSKSVIFDYVPRRCQFTSKLKTYFKFLYLKMHLDSNYTCISEGNYATLLDLGELEFVLEEGLLEWKCCLNLLFANLSLQPYMLFFCIALTTIDKYVNMGKEYGSRALHCCRQSRI